MDYYICETCGNINKELLLTWDAEVAKRGGLCEHAINQPDTKSFNHHPHKHVIIDFSENIELYSDLVIWGTYGRDGKSDLKYVLLKKCTITHLKKIRINLEGQSEINWSGPSSDGWYKLIEYLIEKKRNEIINLMG